LFDDYEELRPGAANELQRRLDHSGFRTHVGASDVSGRATQSLGSTDLTTNQKSTSSASSRETFQSLPKLEPQSSSLQLTQPESECDAEALYLLVCINDAKYATKVLHIDVRAVFSDHQLFKALNDIHDKFHGRWKSRLSLKSIQTIKFVQVSAFVPHMTGW
jgi:hypothetical protein